MCVGPDRGRGRAGASAYKYAVWLDACRWRICDDLKIIKKNHTNFFKNLYGGIFLKIRIARIEDHRPARGTRRAACLNIAARARDLLRIWI